MERAGRRGTEDINSLFAIPAAFRGGCWQTGQGRLHPTAHLRMRGECHALAECGQIVFSGVADVIVMLLLIGAIAMSLALGVLAAHWLCLGLFRIFRLHSLAAARERMAASSARVAIEG